MLLFLFVAIVAFVTEQSAAAGLGFGAHARIFRLVDLHSLAELKRNVVLAINRVLDAMGSHAEGMKS